MTWDEVARLVIARGAPVLGTALGGPLGGAAGEILAEALGINGAAPAQVRETLANRDAGTSTSLAEAEARWVATVQAEAESSRAALADTHARAVAEMTSGDRLQRWWRPLYAMELTLECAVLSLSIAHGFWRGDVILFNALSSGAGLAVAYLGFRFAVLGVYVNGRTQEKLLASRAGAAPGRP